MDFVTFYNTQFFRTLIRKIYFVLTTTTSDTGRLFCDDFVRYLVEIALSQNLVSSFARLASNSRATRFRNYYTLKNMLFLALITKRLQLHLYKQYVLIFQNLPKRTMAQIILLMIKDNLFRKLITYVNIFKRNTKKYCKQTFNLLQCSHIHRLQ